MHREDLRNIAIIAHVDHGKTTLVDAMLRRCGVFRDNQAVVSCVLDSNPLERERGITILAKNIAIHYGQVKINLIDTPGHADFSGEVERVLQMADGALLLVDAVEGPMPQTRFVLRKALDLGLRIIVVISKMDLRDARPDWVLDQVFDLFIDLGGSDEQADFPVIYASGRDGWASEEPAARGGDLGPLFEMLLRAIPAPKDDPAAPFRMLVSNIEHNDYVGRIAVGRIFGGSVRTGQDVLLLKGSKTDAQACERHRIGKLFTFSNLGREEVEDAEAGDIVAISGLPDVNIADTVTDSEHPTAVEVCDVATPTLAMVFSANNSPFAGRDGSFVTGNQLRDRLYRELSSNVALRLEEGDGSFRVCGRGLLHLSILVETMRREGYEMQVGKPQVIVREKDGRWEEPMELLSVEIPQQHLGVVMELLGSRRARMMEMSSREKIVRLDYMVPARGLIGLRSKMLNATRGESVMHHLFDHYGPHAGDIPRRGNGVLIAKIAGRATAYSIWKLQDRGIFFIHPGTEVYAGMIVGQNAREEDIVVNIVKGKHLTNVRAAGSDENIQLTPPFEHSLEEALAFIEEDELVEITPKAIRLRKRFLTERERKRAGQESRAAAQ